MADFFRTKLNRKLLCYFLLLIIYAVFSYSLTAPNLILSNWSPYWKFQTWMWANFFNNRQLLSYSYLIILVSLFITYFKVIKSWPKNKKMSWWLPLVMAVPLLFSNNALSYDVFNYIFNAKMVSFYQVNPHVKVALDFAYDDWTRFMHNTHTPAPYFYGWTGVSLVPYFLGGGKFLPTWISFRLFSFLSLGWLSFSLVKNSDWKNNWLTGLLLNPLLLIEVVSNSHNDLWMMAPAVAAMILVTRKKTALNILLSFLLLLFSASIKLATLALVPIWLALVLPWKKVWPKLHQLIGNNWPLIASLVLFLPLLTPRSKQFLPWYLIWSLVWLPLINKKWQAWKISLIILSISSMLRYVPYLWFGNYDGNVVSQQQLTTWIPFVLFWLIHFVTTSWRARAARLQ